MSGGVRLSRLGKTQTLISKAKSNDLDSADIELVFSDRMFATSSTEECCAENLKEQPHLTCEQAELQPDVVLA